MYLVISTWEAVPGREADMARAGRELAGKLRKQPGVVFLETLNLGSRHITAHAYADEATYRRLVHDPNSEFAKAASSRELEGVGRFVGSESGEAVDYDAA